jgi:hypothetical protein
VSTANRSSLPELGRDDVAQEHPDFARMRAVVAKSLMKASPGQFPSLPSAARVASAVAADVIDAFGRSAR